MPPSGHSSSSHSSSSRSSSSRSSSSRSSSSRSSSSYSGSSRSYSSSSRGPSAHSGSSRSSAYGSSRSASSRSAGPSAPMRPRVNQPRGYQPAGTGAPRYVYGRRHDYIYYPAAWIDSSTGQRYEQGYYDENGLRYEDVAFNRNGRYENVICHCPYCERETVLNLSAQEAGNTSLQCPNCGGTMEIRSALDEVVSTGGTEPAGYSRGTGTNAAAVRSRRRRIGCLIPIVLFVLLCIIASLLPDQSEPETAYTGTESGLQQIVPDARSEDTLYLRRVGDGAYRTGATAGDADKTLVWDADADSYYDAETDCWIWQNVYVDPPVWQYWVEGISSDFGDYGWMEHDSDGWWIEASYGDWIALPGQYDTGGLWYLVD